MLVDEKLDPSSNADQSLNDASPDSSSENVLPVVDEVSGSSSEVDKQGETEESLLSVIKSVSDNSAAARNAESMSESPPEPQQDQEVSERSEAKRADDFSDVPFNSHPRFRKLLEEKNEYKAKFAEYEPDAQQFRQIQTFMDTAHLTPEEVAEGLMLMAEMKSGDPEKAYAALSTKLEGLAITTGKKLPQELEERIEQGYVDRETAQKMHVENATAKSDAARANLVNQQRTQQDAKAQVTAMSTAVSAWESTTRASDPDFDVKAELVKDRVRAHMALHGMPANSSDALALTQSAYDTVTQTLRRVQGGRTAMRTAVGGKVNGSVTPEPKSLLDVIRRATAGA
jgi:hypothetical protein